MKTIAEKLEELNLSLKGMAPKITKAMRMQWALDNNTSLITVDRYLSGKAKMMVFAQKLHDDMKTKIGDTVEA